MFVCLFVDTYVATLLTMLFCRSTVNGTGIYAKWRSEVFSEGELHTIVVNHSKDCSPLLEKQTSHSKTGQVHVGCFHGNGLHLKNGTCPQGELSERSPIAIISVHQRFPY